MSYNILITDTYLTYTSDPYCEVVVIKEAYPDTRISSIYVKPYKLVARLPTPKEVLEIIYPIFEFDPELLLRHSCTEIDIP